jgi:hypothetical protein
VAQRSFGGAQRARDEARHDSIPRRRFARPTQGTGRGARIGRRTHRRARRLLDHLADGGFAAIPRNIRWHGTIVEVAHLCADLGDADRADALRPLLLPVAQEHGVLPLAICYGGPVSRCLARIAELLGESDEAHHRYEEALDACRGLGARPMQAQVLRAGNPDGAPRRAFARDVSEVRRNASAVAGEALDAAVEAGRVR